jgi:serine/threonine-protein kinase
MPRPHPFRVHVAVLLAVLALLVTRSVRAGDPVAAQALYDEAKELASQGRHAEACAKLEESERLDPGLGTEFHLADCWQHVGRTATAWAMFRQVESEARATGQAGRERVAHDRAEALGAFLSKLVIDAGPAATTEGLVLARDGTEIAREQWDAPVPVDPGAHVVSARAPGKRPWETTVQVLPDGKVVRVDVPALADASPPQAAVAPPPPVAPAPAPAARPVVIASPRIGATAPMPVSYEPPVLEERGGAQRAIGWFFIGAGVAAIGGSSYFWLKWHDERNAITTTQRDDALTQSQLAEATAGGGAAAVVVGAIVVATAPGPQLVQRTGRHLRMSPWLGGNRAGLSVGGSF